MKGMAERTYLNKLDKEERREFVKPHFGPEDIDIEATHNIESQKKAHVNINLINQIKDNYVTRLSTQNSERQEEIRLKHINNDLLAKEAYIAETQLRIQQKLLKNAWDE